MLASYQINFGPQPFPWWTVIALLAGVSVLIHAFLFRHHSISSFVFRLSSFAAALIAGALIISVTLLLLLAGVAAYTPALLWTLACVLLAVFFFYQRSYHLLNRNRRISLLALRIGGICSLLLLLFQPVLGWTSDPASKNTLAIVIDATGSMSVNDQPNEPNRYRQSVVAVRDVLAPRLAGLYTIKYFAYDGRHSEPLSSPDDFDSIPPNGTATDLATAIHLASSAAPNQIVLLSDGIHNAPAPVAASLGQFSTPVNTVRVGTETIEPTTVPDIAVASVDSPGTVSVNNQVILTASIKSTAMSDRTIRVILSKSPDATTPSASLQVLDEQRLVLRSGPTPQTVQLKFTPDTVGRMTLRVWVPVDPGERSDANNQQDLPLLVTDTKLPVLYVDGRVREEEGKLVRAIATDPNIQAVSIVQIAAGRFQTHGIKEGDPLMQGLPQTLAQWKRFRVIIFGDLDASKLNAQQERDLKQTIQEGAGFLMIGGEHSSFAPGKWDQTTLADMLPVLLTPVQPAQLYAPFVPKLTPAGVAHPILRNITDFFLPPGGGPAKRDIPMLNGCVAIAGAKAGAETLFIDPSEKVNGAPAVVLAVQQYGKGRTAAFAADTTSQWNIPMAAVGKDSPFNRFWGQMVRWLASQEDLQKKSGPSITALIPKERYDVGEPVILRAAVTDKDGQATEHASAVANITGPDGRTQRINMTPVADQIGMYECKTLPATVGEFKVLFGANKDNISLGTDTSTFSVLQTIGEMDKLAADPALLQSVARSTGGAYTDLPGLGSLADRLAESAAPRSLATTTSYPLYHFRWFFLLFIAAMTGEWFLRRKWQLQ